MLSRPGQFHPAFVDFSRSFLVLADGCGAGEGSVSLHVHVICAEKRLKAIKAGSIIAFFKVFPVILTSRNTFEQNNMNKDGKDAGDDKPRS